MRALVARFSLGFWLVFFQPVGDVDLLVAGSHIENDLGKKIELAIETLDQDRVLFIDYLLAVSVSLRCTLAVILLLLGKLLLG